MATARHLSRTRTSTRAASAGRHAAPGTGVPGLSRRGAQSLLVLGVAAGGVAATVPSGLGVGIGVADPAPTVASVQHQVDVLNDKVEAVDEAFDASRLALAEASRRSAAAEARVRAAQAELDSLKVSMGQLASSVYESGGNQQLVSLVDNDSPQAFLDQAASLDRIASRQSAQLLAAETARVRVATATQAATEALAAQQKLARAVAGQKSTIDHALAQQESLLAHLTAAQRAQLLAAAVRNAPLTASRSRTSSAALVADVPATGLAAVAVQAAYAELGKPYSYGASGPGSFDCSGLTAWVWGKAGVSLSHSSQAQYGEGQHVSQADIQPGDLVFFGSPIHHVGIYIGGGQMISAPHTGTVVKIQPAFRSDFVGAVRP